MTILETNKLTKQYKRLTALNQLDFDIQKGMVFGLLGPNGSGKTTTLGILLSVLKATSGTFKWFGQPPSPESRKKIGAILEIPCFFPYLTAVQNLLVISKIKDCPPSAIDAALLVDPPVLILDEPTNGLDPQGYVEIRELIKDIAASGKTIILASHLLDEVQKLCSHFMVLQKGKKRFQGSVAEALMDHRSFEVAADDAEQLRNALSDFKGVQQMKQEDGIFILTPEQHLTTSDLSRFLFDRQIVINHLVEKSGSLEKQFLRILQDHD